MTDPTVRAALEPFISFSDGTMFTYLPDDFVLTAGSRLAHRQLTAGDFRKLREALAALPQPGARELADLADSIQYINTALEFGDYTLAERVQKTQDALRAPPVSGADVVREARSALTKLAAECHRAKWQFDFNDEARLPVGQARDMVKRSFSELHRIGDMALELRSALASSGNAGALEPEDKR